VTRSRSTYQNVAGGIGMMIGVALALVVDALASQAVWTLITSMVLSGACTFAAVLVGDRVWLRRKYGKGPS
jgi:VIT1/CCC1 family predicted Fe2+/Mn2+ transporter